jgi:hypothetical protein
MLFRCFEISLHPAKILGLKNLQAKYFGIKIFWKRRQLGLSLTATPDAEIARALRFPSDARTSEKSAVETLDRPHGVGVPMASAILRTIRPENYTVIDVRALESLGVSKTDGSVNDYLSILFAGVL